MTDKIAIVTDHGCDLQQIPEISKDENIFFIPVYINFGKESFSSNDLSTKSFFEKLEQVTKENYPKTSSGSIGDCKNVYEEVKAKGYTKVLSIHPLSKSRILETAKLAAEEVPDLDIEVINSQSVSIGQGASVLKARSLLSQKLSYQDIIKELAEFAPQTKCYISPKSLKYAVKGGRVTPTKYFLGRLLRINPVLKAGQGDLIPYQKAYGVKKSRDKAYQLATENRTQDESFEYVIAHANNEELAMEFETKLRTEYPHATGYTTEVGAGIGAHVGPDSLLMVTY